MQLRVAIIDDESSSRNVIRQLLLAQYPDARIVGEADSVRSGLDLLRREQPDLLFLDVEMEDGTGFDILDQVQPRDFAVVFVTAHDLFAVRAFRYHAMDYLLKPVDPEEFLEVLIRAGSAPEEQRDVQITQLLETATNHTFDQIVLPTNNGLVFTRTVDIVRLETVGNYAFVFLADGKRYLVSRTLKDFQEILSTQSFFRLHQSHIVSASYVRQLVKEDGGWVVMQDGSRLPLARRRKDAFLQFLKPHFPDLS